MATINSGIVGDSNFLNLRSISINDVRDDAKKLLINGETIISCFKTLRDQVIFTTKRIIVVNVQGITGKKVSFISYPYSKVQYYGIETAGLIDSDSELLIAFSDGMTLTFDFQTSVNIYEICLCISNFVLN